MIRYRLYTRNAANLPMLVARYFPCAALFEALSVWEPESHPDYPHEVTTEQSCVIEILGSRADHTDVTLLASCIKQTNREQSVVMTWHDINTQTI